MACVALELGCTTRSNEATEETIKLAQEKTKGQEGGKSKEGGVLDGILGTVSKAVGSATDKVGETVNDAKESVAELLVVTIKVVDMFEGLLTVSNDSQVKYQRGNILCKLAESHDSIGKKIKTINEKGNPLDRLEKIIGKQPDAQRRARSGTSETMFSARSRVCPTPSRTPRVPSSAFPTPPSTGLKRLIGKPCDKSGAIHNEGGDTIGRVELIPEIERDRMKEAPSPSCLAPPSIRRAIVATSDDVVGRLDYGGTKALFGRAVDNDGDIPDKKGNVGPRRALGARGAAQGDQLHGRPMVNEEVNDIPVPEPETKEESDGDKQKHLRIKQDREIAKRICVCAEYSLDKSCPIRKTITENIDRVERQPEEEWNKEDLVRAIKPLIEGGKVLGQAAAHEAHVEMCDLAGLLEEFMGTVTKAIKIAKSKLEGFRRTARASIQNHNHMCPMNCTRAPEMTLREEPHIHQQVLWST
ncbi:LEA domain containing protein [Apiospora arundinis]